MKSTVGDHLLERLAREWGVEWSDPRLVVLVLNNRDLNQVTSSACSQATRS
jgi:hypothetical protein